MIAQVMTFGKGIRINKNTYLELIVNQGTDKEPNLVSVYINLKCDPEKYIGKEVKIPINVEKMIPSPINHNIHIVISDEICLA